MKLIGISGTNGAGKDSVGEYLQDKHGFLFISVTDLLRDEAKRRGLSTERIHLRTISAEWRRESGLGVLIDKAVELYKDRLSKGQSYSGLVVSSLRNGGEADSVHSFGGKVVWIDADTKLRYDRIHSRNREDDRISFEEFEQQQAAEMIRPEGADEATLSTVDVKDKSDVTLMNNGTTLEELDEQVDKLLKELYG